MTEDTGEMARELLAEQERIDAGVASYIEQLGTPGTLEQAIAERNAWVESACQFSRNESYYCGLIDQIGEMFGEEAYVADDGSRSQDILRAKVPDLVAKALTLSQQAVREEALEEAWRAAWTAEPLPEVPLANPYERATFNYGRDCATAAVKALSTHPKQETGS